MSNTTIVNINLVDAGLHAQHDMAKQTNFCVRGLDSSPLQRQDSESG